MPAFNLPKARGRATFKGWSGSVAGPSSYPSGGFTVTIDDLRTIYDAVVVAGGGYLAEVASISGNTITIKVYQFNYGAGSPGPAVEVPDGTDLSGVTFRIIAVGE